MPWKISRRHQNLFLRKNLCLCHFHQEVVCRHVNGSVKRVVLFADNKILLNHLKYWGTNRKVLLVYKGQIKILAGNGCIPLNDEATVISAKKVFQ